MYNAHGITDKEQCLREYAPLVKRIAHQMMSRLPASVQIDDMIQAGMIGLLDAASRYDEFHGAQFETYASQRIRGSMLDELREADWLPRGLRRDLRRIETTTAHLQQELGRPPSEGEISKALDMPLRQYQSLLGESRGSQLLYFEDFDSSDENNDHFLDRFDISREDADPLELLADDRFRHELVHAIENLPEREKMLMGMLYEQDMNLREIGEVLGVSESRVSQLHSQAVSRLRGRLKGY